MSENIHSSFLLMMPRPRKEGASFPDLTRN
jgi:hypothetical protein